MADRLKKPGMTLARLRSGEMDPIDRRTKDGRSKADRRDFMADIREKFELWTEADDPQRQRELSDEAFYALEHWPADIKLARAGQNASNGLPPIPARPCLVIDKLSEPVNQILNVERDADLGIELTPADDFEGLGVVLDSTEITLREGLIRRIQRDSQSAAARSWAFKRAVVAGRGFYGVMTRFAPGKTFDQELFVEGYYNQSCVTPDPAHEQPDGSDMEGAYVGRWLPWTEYKSRWPSAAKRRNLISNLTDRDFLALGDEAPKWFKTDPKNPDLRMVYVVDHFYVVKTNRTLAQLADGSSEWNDELPDGADLVDTREVVERTVKWCKLDGANPEPLEETDWPGPDIPVIKVVGEEVLPYDDERRVMGLVRPGKDPSYGFDAMASKLVEVVAQTPIPGVMMASGQDEGFEKEWNLSTTRSLGRLHYNVEDANGNKVGPPTSVPREAAPIQPIAMSLSMFDEAVQTGTRSHDPSLGKVDPTLRSGKAIEQVVNRSKEGTSNFLDNLKRSIRYEAQILNNLLYPIYGARPGRLVKIVTGQDKPETIMLGQPYTVHPTTQRPIGLQVPNPDQPGQAMPAPMGHPALPPNAQQFALTEYAKCNVAITITKSAETRRQQAEQFYASIIQAEPQTAPWFLDLAFKYSDMAGHEEAEERARLMWPPPLQAAQAAKSGKQTPEQLAQQLGQAKQLLDQAHKENQDLQKKLSGKVVEQQGKMAVTQVQEQAQSERAAADREVKLAVAELGARVDRMALLIEESKLVGARAHEAMTAGHEHAQNMIEADKGRAHEIVRTALEHQAATEQADQAHGHALEQGAQAAALAPEPAAPTGE
jgi:hypothetical protein